MFHFTRALVRTAKDTLFIRVCNVSATVSSTSAELKNFEEGETGIKFNQRGVSINPKVAAAFATLELDKKKAIIETPFTDRRIQEAKDVNELLSISNGVGITRRHALKVVSVLADWTSNGKVSLSDFETDNRFIKLCKLLTKNVRTTNTSSKSEDLSVVMHVTEDDEAAKLISTITLPQMVKVIQKMAEKKHRSPVLLRSLAFNITKSTDDLSLKESADLLYSMAILNFPDENLLQFVSKCIVANLEQSLRKSTLVGSILTSLGFLRYKSTNGVIEALCDWMINNSDVCRPPDVFSLFLTLAVLNYQPSNFDKLFEVFIPHLSTSDAIKSAMWLDFVWSLVILNVATTEHLSSVLIKDFIEEIGDENVALKLKLLNVNAAATHLIKDYNVPNVNESTILDTAIIRSKDKQELVASVLDTLKNLIPTDNYIETNVNTKMGVLIDAKCIFDKKCNPVQLSNYDSVHHHKVAIMIFDYHDMCRGQIDLTGANSLAVRLLKANGYKVLQIPFSEYSSREKLIYRVQYVEKKLKLLMQQT